jgi:hypothetical protein
MGRAQLLRPAIRAFVLKFKQSVTGLDYPLRSYRHVAGGAKLAFNKAAQFLYEICKLRLIFVSRSQREPSRFIIQPKLPVQRITCLGGAPFSLQCLLIAIFYVLVGILQHGAISLLGQKRTSAPA